MNQTTQPTQRGNAMNELYFVLGFLALWIALQAWILPSFGIET
jgi:hypothetical protein